MPLLTSGQLSCLCDVSNKGLVIVSRLTGLNVSLKGFNFLYFNIG